MTEEQKKAIIDFTLDKIGEGELVVFFDIDLSDPQALGQLLEDAARSNDSDEVECALMLVGPRCNNVALMPTLLELLRAPWHTSHEEIVQTLQAAQDPRAVDALYEAALVNYEYRDYDEVFGLARRCTWALADIGSDEARAKLQLLARCDNPTIAGYAQRRLDLWGEELDRKGRR